MAKRQEEAFVWERRDGESAEAYAAFSEYRDMAYRAKDADGKETIKDTPVCRRSIRLVGEKLGKSEGLLERWSSQWDWLRRAEAYDRYVDAEALRKATANLADMRARHIKIAKMMQAKGLQAMNTFVPEKVEMKDAIKLMTDGMKFEEERMSQEVEAYTPTESDTTEQETLDKLDEILAKMFGEV